MKHFLIIVFLALTNLTFAQPQFKRDNCFKTGDSGYVNSIVVTQNFDDFIFVTGSNYNWNFTSNGIPGPWGTWAQPNISYYFRPASQSGSSVFANSQINEYCEAAFTRNQYYTYAADNDTLYLDGFISSSINYARTPSIPYLTFPLNFGDSVFTHTILYGIPTQPTRATGSVTRYWIYDGYGSISFPYKTFNNVFRIRTKQIDSTYIASMAVMYDEIIWFDASKGIPVLRFLKNGTLITAWYSNYVAEPTATKEFEGIGNIKVYPNPANNYLNIENYTNKNIQYVMAIDASGKKIMVEPNGDISSLANGFYLIQIIFEDGQIFSHKMLIQH
ncbi:MAG: T9SS type A sorting domain-containing protein [Bacteroidia bacterium]